MSDWTAGLGVLISAVAWIQIFIDYRRKLVRIMPSVSSVSSRRDDISTQIFLHRFRIRRTSVQSIQGQIVAARKEIEDLEERRVELQERLNPEEMVLVPASKVRIGTSDPTREDENPEHQVTISAFYITFPTSARPTTPSSTSPGKTPGPTRRGSASVCPPRLNGNAPHSATVATSNHGEKPAMRVRQLRQPRRPDDAGGAVQPRG